MSQFSKEVAHELFLTDPIAYQNYVDSYRVAANQQTANNAETFRNIAVFYDRVSDITDSDLGTENAGKVMSKLQEKNLPPTADNLEREFRALYAAGEITGLGASNGTANPDLERWVATAPREEVERYLHESDARVNRGRTPHMRFGVPVGGHYSSE